MGNKAPVRREVCDFCPRAWDVALVLDRVQREQISHARMGHSDLGDLKSWPVLLLAPVARMGNPPGFFLRPPSGSASL